MNFYIRAVLVAVLLISFSSRKVYAQSSDPDESFDPFSDYNEFEQESEEEADINFLRNGRYLTLAFVSGYRGFTGGFSSGYTGALDYGVQFNYFFDLNLALSFGYTTGDHNVDFTSASKTNYTGNVNIQVIDLHIKYYFNTDNVTKGLADLNPYMIGGAGFYTRTYSLTNNIESDPDKVVGFKTGAGLEIPLVRRSFYLGFQGVYNYVQFPDENKDGIEEGINSDGSTRVSKISPQLYGDIFEIQAILGVNF